MISAVQKTYFSLDEDHLIGSYPQNFVGKPQMKWISSYQPIFEFTNQLNDWDRPLHDSQSLNRGSGGTLSISDDEIFHRAAADVNHKIEIDRKVLGGAPCFAGTRIPVYAIMELVEAGYSHKKILRSYPSLSREDLDAALRFSVIVMTR